MDGRKNAPAVLSGILEKRRQNLKFHWRTYLFILDKMKLSYYKTTASNDKEVTAYALKGKLWGTIDMQHVQSLRSINPIGHRHSLEIELRNGKVIVLSAENSLETVRWLQALQGTVVAARKRLSSDIPVTCKIPDELDKCQSTCEWINKPNTAIKEADSPDCIAGTTELGDLDAFIDQTFTGITFNRQSQMVRMEPQQQLPDQDCNTNNT
ncbi:hypothetical protein FKM82_002803 [Ascaphus truei]